MYKVKITNSTEMAVTIPMDQDKFGEFCLETCGGGHDETETRRAMDMQERLLQGEILGFSGAKVQIVEGLEEPGHSGL